MLLFDMGKYLDLKNVKYDKQVTIDTMDQYPEFVEELVNFKVDGKQFFSMRDVNDIIYHCLSGDDGPKAKPESIRNILNNPLGYTKVKGFFENRTKKCDRCRSHLKSGF